MALFGAAIGPVALAWGLQHTSGTSASLMLTLEALFTALLAQALYREAMGGRVWTAMLLLLTGGVLLVIDRGQNAGAQVLGLMAVLGRDRSLGYRQHAVPRSGRSRSGPGSAGKVRDRCRRHRGARRGYRGADAGMGRCRRSDGYRCERLWTEFAVLPAGTASVRCGTNRLGVCVRTVHRSTACDQPRGPIIELGNGLRWRGDAGRRPAASRRVARSQTRTRRA